MRCRHCHGKLPDASRFCSDCGAAQSDEAAVLPQNDDTLLAEANLYRVRGDWAAAAERCALVLQRSPGHALARSLLGDIYEARGRLADARHWYQQALEANPGSEADRCKLARVLVRLDAWERQRDDSTPPPLLRESIQRIIVVVGLVLFAVIAVALVMSTQPPRPLDEPPLIVPNPRPPAPPSPLTEREEAMLNSLTARVAAESPGQARLLLLAPAGDAATLSVALPTPEWLRQDGASPAPRLAAEAYRFAYHLRAVEPALREITVRIVGPPATGEPQELLYAATMAAERLSRAPEAITAEELESAASNASWNSRLAQ